MDKKQRTSETLERIWYVIECILLFVLLALAIGIAYKTYQSEFPNFGRIKLHRYVLYGFLVFFPFLIIPRIRKNVHWLMTFTHEFTHMFFALIFFRKMHRLNVSEKDSHVSFSGGWFGRKIITLAPYCIPIFTLVMLPWRLTTPTASKLYLHIIDILIGFTYAFHVIMWARQTRFHQSDIEGVGKLRSMLIILIAWIVGLCIVLMTPSSGVQLAFARAFWLYPEALVTQLIQLF